MEDIGQIYRAPRLLVPKKERKKRTKADFTPSKRLIKASSQLNLEKSRRKIRREQPHTENKKVKGGGGERETCQAVCSHLPRLERERSGDKDSETPGKT